MLAGVGIAVVSSLSPYYNKNKTPIRKTCSFFQLPTGITLHYGIIKNNFFFFFYYPEPNNDSPLNVPAAELWANQTAYKKVLLEKYQKDVLSKEDS